MTSWIATVETDHTVRVPEELAAGEQVLIVRMPSISSLLNDPERQNRFAETRAAVKEAMRETNRH